jgi:hypothetical protein
LAGKGEQATDALNNQLVNRWQNIEKTTEGKHRSEHRLEASHKHQPQQNLL